MGRKGHTQQKEKNSRGKKLEEYISSWGRRGRSERNMMTCQRVKMAKSSHFYSFTPFILLAIRTAWTWLSFCFFQPFYIWKVRKEIRFAIP